jgi:calcineurin-like phosphoesterase family protein
MNKTQNEKQKRKQIWFTSDTHFGHKNIIRFSERPFKDVEHMDAMLIQNWNECVKQGDDVYHLGDFSLTNSDRTLRILNQLNGNIHLIKGNHEKSITGDAKCKGKFAWIKDYYELKVQDPDAKGNRRSIVLLHYAMKVWNKSHHGAWHLYGHSHGSLPETEDSLSFDCGVDSHDYRPISYDEVKRFMSKKTWKPLDHHQ